jgi:indolepyruvate ferredoxin oxidoreductase, alpha subunit
MTSQPIGRLPDVAGRIGAATELVPAVRLLAEDLIAAGVRHYLAVPGYPATALLDELQRLGATVEDAHDEKTAAEMAYGLSIGGTPVAVLVKGNGALLSAEPLQNAGPHGIGAPLLLVVGDDVQAISSTVPTDSRVLGDVLVVPVLDAPAGEARRATVSAAVTASTSVRRPVLLRFTGSLARSLEAHDPSVLPQVARRATVEPAAGLVNTKLSRFLEYAVTRAPDLQRVADDAPFTIRPGGGRQGIIACGSTWETLVGGLPADRPEPALGLTCVAPLPQRVVEFCRPLERVLVLEEGRPVVEDAVQLLLARAGVACAVDGQRNQVLPPLGPTSVDDVLGGLAGRVVPPPGLQVRPVDRDVDAHQYRVLFEALALVRDDADVDVQSCVGSCITAAYPPWSLAGTALNLGGSTGVAAGVAAATGRPGIALIGDYGLIHSGLPALDHVQQRGLPVLTIVLANGVSAKTGGQPSANAPGADGGRPLDLEGLVTRTAPGLPVRTVRLVETDADGLAAVVRELLGRAPATLLLVADGVEGS